MKSLLLVFELLIATITLSYAQEKWGFAVATSMQQENDSTWIKYVFVSDVVKLSEVICNKVSGVNEHQFYSECIRSWFYEKLLKSKLEGTNSISMEFVYGVTKMFNNLDWLNEKLDKTDSLGVYNVYMDERLAKHKYEIFTKMDTHGKSILIAVH